MNVKELREFLSHFPDDMLVIRDAGGDCDGYSDIASKHPHPHWFSHVIHVNKLKPTGSYFGSYDECKPNKGFAALLLR